MLTNVSALNASDIRWDVIRRLQTLAAQHTPGTETFEIAQHAISLSLNPKRQVVNTSFLYRNVWRDSQRILRRSPKRYELPLNEVMDTVGHGQKISQRLTFSLIDNNTPESALTAHDLEVKIRRMVSDEGPHGERCLHGLLIGETIEETAVALGISTRRVKRLRDRLRRLADELLYPMPA